MYPITAVTMIILTAAAKWPGAGVRIFALAVNSKNSAVSICKKAFTAYDFVIAVRVTARLLRYVDKVNRISRRPVIKLDKRQITDGESSYNASNKGSMLHPATIELRNKVLRIK